MSDRTHEAMVRAELDRRGFLDEYNALSEPFADYLEGVIAKSLVSKSSSATLKLSQKDPLRQTRERNRQLRLIGILDDQIEKTRDEALIQEMEALFDAFFDGEPFSIEDQNGVEHTLRGIFESNAVDLIDEVVDLAAELAAAKRHEADKANTLLKISEEIRKRMKKKASHG